SARRPAPPPGGVPPVPGRVSGGLRRRSRMDVDLRPARSLPRLAALWALLAALPSAGCGGGGGSGGGGGGVVTGGTIAGTIARSVGDFGMLADREPNDSPAQAQRLRSEERRVGKECRCGGAAGA